MAKTNRKTTKTSFWDCKQGFKNVASASLVVGKEASSIVAYGMREVTGQSQVKPKCTLKTRWFE